MKVQKDVEQNETKAVARYANHASKRVLEIGCGDGRLTWRYAQAASRVTGIDVDRDGLRIATIDRPSDLENLVTFAQADSARLPFPNEAFDLAIFAWSF